MIFIMAWRNIWRNKLRSIVIMLSIALGLFAGIAILALYEGMIISRVRSVVDAEVGHLQIHDTAFKKDLDPKFIMREGDLVLQSVQKTPGIKQATPRSITTGMLATATGSSGVQVNGILPEEEYRASMLKQKIREGRGFDPARKNEVMVGKKLAKKMKLKTGSKLVLSVTDATGSIVSGAFRVIAVYQSNNTPLDERNVYVTMDDLNELLGIGKAFHEISVLLDRDKDVEKIKEQLQTLLPQFQVETWMEISPETQLMVNTTNQYAYIIMVIIMFALAFGIINTMLMAILERTREIGMMAALGTSRGRIFFLVLLETVLLTLAGAPFGMLTGWLVTFYFHRHGLDLSGMGSDMMSSFGFGTMIYPEFPADKLAGIILIVTGTALVSCLFPAIKALKLKPVDALRR